MTVVEAEQLFKNIPVNSLSSSNNNMHIIFLKLINASFNNIKQNPDMLKDIENIKKLFKQRGDNIHLIKAFGNGYKEFKEIINNLKLIYKPKTITYYRDDFKRLHVLKGDIQCLG